MMRVLLLAGVVLAGGCAVGPPPVATPPVDFVLDAAVLAPTAADADLPSPADAWVGHRYILFADGSLHHDVGTPTASGHLPPARRVLTRSEMSELWQMAETCGLTDPAASGRLDHLQASGNEDTPVVVVLLGGQGQWWSHRQSFASDDPVARPPSMLLIGRLAELAWAGEFDRRAVVAPKRYDFGPDPYARFR